MISVIIPIYGVEQYLDRCIESVVRQTFSNLEIILVNDGSPDNCATICNDWQSRDKRIKVIHKSHGGLSDARNVGIASSNGEFLLFIDADDYVEPDMLEKLYWAIVAYNAEISVCGYLQEYCQSPSQIKKDEVFGIVLDAHEEVFNGREFLLRQKGRLSGPCVVVWNKLFRRELFNDIVFPFGVYHEDEFVFHLLVYPCKRIVCIPYIGYHYFQRPDSIMNRKPDLQRISDLLSALIYRCEWMVCHNEKELSMKYDGMILQQLLSARQTCSRKELAPIWKRYFAVICRMRQKGWVSFFLLFKRLVRCLIGKRQT